MLVFDEGKTGVPGEKPLGAKERTNKKPTQPREQIREQNDDVKENV